MANLNNLQHCFIRVICVNFLFPNCAYFPPFPWNCVICFVCLFLLLCSFPEFQNYYFYFLKIKNFSAIKAKCSEFLAVQNFAFIDDSASVKIYD